MQMMIVWWVQWRCLYSAPPYSLQNGIKGASPSHGTLSHVLLCSSAPSSNALLLLHSLTLSTSVRLGHQPQLLSTLTHSFYFTLAPSSHLFHSIYLFISINLNWSHHNGLRSEPLSVQNLRWSHLLHLLWRPRNSLRNSRVRAPVLRGVHQRLAPVAHVQCAHLSHLSQWNLRGWHSTCSRVHSHLHRSADSQLRLCRRWLHCQCTSLRAEPTPSPLSTEPNEAHLLLPRLRHPSASFSHAEPPLRARPLPGSHCLEWNLWDGQTGRPNAQLQTIPKQTRTGRLDCQKVCQSLHQMDGRSKNSYGGSECSFWAHDWPNLPLRIVTSHSNQFLHLLYGLLTTPTKPLCIISMILITHFLRHCWSPTASHSLVMYSTPPVPLMHALSNVSLPNQTTLFWIIMYYSHYFVYSFILFLFSLH